MGISYLYLIEDNASSHQTARQVDNKERQSHGIITLDWPSKSPDLNSIKWIWEYKKDDISTWKFMGSERAAIEGAKHVLVETWAALPQAVINQECQSFHEKLQQLILCAGNNNFNG
ncbi:hypothetical protein L873DRAFT_1790343 [Choiromyces venosus 120613-1]|uniref:Tc1-like transposase DDE domain-containing protein n=1 Tax=Choiromyces venosus 120613-1 TaxID=1336337 RepID=A0A3N4JJB3_9PEZI|nr:hypothetical protein L873DRAFT_1790343 [Choiromyces venosus 120613-1]